VRASTARKILEEPVMRYALLVCTDESAAISEHERARRAAAGASFRDQMRERGVLLAGERLQPTATATTVRCWDGGDVMIAGGPFAQAREQVSSLFIVDCKDLDEAIDVATRIPAAWYGTVEVRPVDEM
jgi:hypothetical protein